MHFVPTPRAFGPRWHYVLLTNAAAMGFSLLAGCQQSDKQQQDQQSQYNLKQIGQALHQYSDVHKRLPPWALCDSSGKPLLSWRVLILPYIEQSPLYLEFHLDEPWDSPHNLTLLAKMPGIYATPVGKTVEPGRTFYQAFVGPGAGWELLPDAHAPHKAQGLRLNGDFPDGAASTIAVIEAGEPVPWTKPADLPFEKGKPLPKIGGVFEDHANALLFDMTVRSVAVNVAPANLEAAITRNGGETLPAEWHQGK
jgi:hypothetical protein